MATSIDLDTATILRELHNMRFAGLDGITHACLQLTLSEVGVGMYSKHVTQAVYPGSWWRTICGREFFHQTCHPLHELPRLRRVTHDEVTCLDCQTDLAARVLRCSSDPLS